MLSKHRSLFHKCQQAVETIVDVALIDDMKWFFKGVVKFAETLEYLLPSVVESKTNNQTFAETTRSTLLLGLRHLLVGIREISITFVQNFKTEHIKQLQQLKHAAELVRSTLNSIRLWFSHLRILMTHLFRLYNHYMPEVLLGKCISHYLRTTYPYNYFYEYPVLLLVDMYTSIIPQENVEPKISQLIGNAANNDNKEQNEITYDSDTGKQSYLDDSPDGTNEKKSNTESLFNLSTVIDDDKNLIIERAADKHSLKICLKLYTVETLSRTLKNYFLH
uniref:Uncharacterized protein n=1 Tax=Glossina austeni TaxID=7395 RepID=A0A1A9UDD8_GLOAU